MSTTQNFYQLSVELTESQLLTSTEKIFISLIQSYQRNEKKVYATNAKLAKKLGIGIEGLKTMIKRMNKKYNFFTSTRLKEKATSDNWTSTHEISIDEEKLKAFLACEITSIQNEIAPAQASIEEQLPIAPAAEPTNQSTNSVIVELNDIEAVTPKQEPILKHTPNVPEPVNDKTLDVEQYLIDKQIDPNKLIKYKSDLEFLLPIIGGGYAMMLETIHDKIRRSNDKPISLKEAIPYIDNEIIFFFKHKKHLLVESLPTKQVPPQAVTEPLDKSVSRPLLKKQRFPIEQFTVAVPVEFEGKLEGSKVNVEIPMEGKQVQVQSEPIEVKPFDIRNYSNEYQKKYCDIERIERLKDYFKVLKIEAHKDFYKSFSEANIMPCKLGSDKFSNFVNDYYKDNPTQIKPL